MSARYLVAEPATCRQYTFETQRIVSQRNRLLRRLQSLDKLSKRDREALMRTLDAFLLKAQPG